MILTIIALLLLVLVLANHTARGWLANAAEILVLLTFQALLWIGIPLAILAGMAWLVWRVYA
jgi:hypothetical protein